MFRQQPEPVSTLCRAPTTLRRPRKRWNLLLLDEDEDYLCDYIATYFPPQKSFDESYRIRQPGRLKLCSRSVHFEPDDTARPIVKFPLEKVEDIGRWEAPPWQAHTSSQNDILMVITSETVEIMPAKCYRPVQTSGPVLHRFAFTYALLAPLMVVAGDLLQLNRVTAVESRARIKEYVAQREANVPKFDASWGSTRESELLSLPALRIKPLISNRSRVVLTDSRIYVQYFNNISVRSVKMYEARALTRITLRRHKLRHIGIELFFVTGQPGGVSRQKSVFLSFQSTAARDKFHAALLSHPVVAVTPPDTANATLQWCNGLMSTFDYLWLLNDLAGRTTNDLTQYPVFPWIIADYSSPRLDLNNPDTFRDLSKPIGALYAPRLAAFKERRDNLPATEKPFLYGTHYSTPGYVLYYLVRQAPEYMLRLQNGRFDHPDRLFNSVSRTWESVLTNHADLKELIPEFYCGNGDFCLNQSNLDLGFKQNNERVDAVALPPWANDPADFIAKNRAALECDYVSQHIHNWIDLIFGFKSTGDEAVDADNVFYSLTYEGAVDVDAISDPLEKAARESQILEFGQTPHQLFSRPHPRRFSCAFSKLAKSDSTPDTTASAFPPQSSSQASLSSSFHNTTITTTTTTTTTSDPFSFSSSSSSSSSSSLSSSFSSAAVTAVAPRASAALAASAAALAQSRLASGSISSLSASDFSSDPFGAHARAWADADPDDFALSTVPAFRSLSPPPAHQPSQTPSVNSSTRWVCPPEHLSCVFSKKIHRAAATAVSFNAAQDAVCVASQDGTVKIFSLVEQRQLRSFVLSQLSVSACRLTNGDSSVIASSWDNHIYVYSVDYGRVVDQVPAHSDAVTSVHVTGSTVLSSSWDCTIKIWGLLDEGLNRRPIAILNDHETGVEVLDVDASGNYAASGSIDGTVKVWDIRAARCVRTIDACDDAIKGLSLSADGHSLAVCSADASLKFFQADSGAELYSVPLDEQLRCVVSDGLFAVGGTENGTLRAWELSRGSELSVHSDSRSTSSAAVSALVVANDGRSLVSSSSDGVLCLWRPRGCG